MQNQGNKRILIVDDENDLTEALAIRLSSGWGFTVAVAHDGEEGLRKAASFRPNMILLDLAMPVVDGWEMCRRLRDNPDTRHIPIVIMTAWQTDDLNRRAEEECVVKVLLKPAEDHDLLDVLRAASGMTRPAEAVGAGRTPTDRREARPDRRRSSQGRSPERRRHK